MEVEIRAKEKYGGIITVCFLFEKFKNTKNVFLWRLGFGKDKFPKTKFYIEQKKKQYLKGVFNLQNLVGDQDKYMMYEGESPTGSCQPSIIFVSHKINWISDEQYEDIRDNTILAMTKAIKSGQQIYQNISPKIRRRPFPLDFPIKRPKTITTAMFAPFVYSPINLHSLGYIHPADIPGWAKVNKKSIINKIKKPKLPKNLKYVPYYYEKVENMLKPVHIVVPSGFFFTRNIQPNEVPIWIRTNYTHANGVRDIVRIKMPVRYDPNEKVAPKKKHKSATKRRRLRFHRAPKQRFRFRRVCTDWHMGVILNRYFADKKAWDYVDKVTGITPGSLLQCRNWKVIRVNYLGLQVDTHGNIVKKQINKNTCKTYISVILNKVHHPLLKDYVARACGPYAYIRRAPHDDPNYVVPQVVKKESGKKRAVSLAQEN